MSGWRRPTPRRRRRSRAGGGSATAPAAPGTARRELTAAGPARAARAGAVLCSARKRKLGSSDHTFWVISCETLACMLFMPASGAMAPVRICSQTVEISFSTALPFGTPTIIVE